MNISTETREAWTVLTLKEERLDAMNSGELRDKILGLLESGGQRLIVNLTGVSFIDSSGLGALPGYKNANLRSSQLVLAGLQPRVQSMFELTRLHRVFEIHPTLDDALAVAREEVENVPQG